MKILKHILPLFTAILVMSCEKEIEIKIEDHESKLTIATHLEADSIPRVIVAHSLHSTLARSQYKVLSDAQVVLFENSVAVDTLSYFNDSTNNDPVLKVGEFKGDYVIQAGKTYKVQANQGDFETAFGQTVCPSKSIEITDVDLSGIQIKTVNEGGVQSSYYRTGKLKFKLSHPLSKDYHYFLSIVDRDGEIEGGFIVTSNDFIITKEEYNETRDPIDGAEWYNQDLYFSGASLNSTTSFTIEINPGDDIWYYESDPTDALVLRLEVQNYDCHEFNLKMENYKDAQYNPFAEMVFLYDNIQGGYGIVSAKTKYEKVLE